MFMKVCNLCIKKMVKHEKWVFCLLSILSLSTWRKHAFDTLKKVGGHFRHPLFYTHPVYREKDKVSPLNCIYIWNGHWLLSYSGFLKPPCSLLSLPLPPLTELYCLWLVDQFCFAKIKVRLLWCNHVLLTPVIKQVICIIFFIAITNPCWSSGIILAS